MEFPEILLVPPARIHLQEEEPSALARLEYLCPSRYFRFYMLHERNTRSTCWIPEGYDT